MLEVRTNRRLLRRSCEWPGNAILYLMSIAANIASTKERIAAAARRSARSADEILLMAVSKTHPAERIREAYEAGLRLFGENRVQEFASKIGALRDLPDAEWHMIGHLQTNKAGKTVELFNAPWIRSTR
jgi:PLP dependent protein